MLSQGTNYISSEDSESDDDMLHRRPLIWLKKKYRKSLHDLDKLYYNQLTKKAKLMTRKRTDGANSERAKPDNAPAQLIHEDSEANTSIEAD